MSALPRPAWVQLCLLHLRRLRPEVTPVAAMYVAIALYDEHGDELPPQEAADQEVFTWRNAEITRKRQKRR